MSVSGEVKIIDPATRDSKSKDLFPPVGWTEFQDLSAGANLRVDAFMGTVIVTIAPSAPYRFSVKGTKPSSWHGDWSRAVKLEFDVTTFCTTLAHLKSCANKTAGKELPWCTATSGTGNMKIPCNVTGKYRGSESGKVSRFFICVNSTSKGHLNIELMTDAEKVRSELFGMDSIINDYILKSVSHPFSPSAQVVCLASTCVTPMLSVEFEHKSTGKVYVVEFAESALVFFTGANPTDPRTTSHPNCDKLQECLGEVCMRGLLKMGSVGALDPTEYDNTVRKMVAKMAAMEEKEPGAEKLHNCRLTGVESAYVTATYTAENPLEPTVVYTVASEAGNMGQVEEIQTDLDRFIGSSVHLLRNQTDHMRRFIYMGEDTGTGYPDHLPLKKHVTVHIVYDKVECEKAK
jgi:hypothetical protein